jgi:hypothetical protein
VSAALMLQLLTVWQMLLVAVHKQILYSKCCNIRSERNTAHTI